MREALDPWLFVNGAYLLTIGATLVLAAWSWWAMRSAERRRDEGRK